MMHSAAMSAPGSNPAFKPPAALVNTIRSTPNEASTRTVAVTSSNFNPS